MGGWGSPKLAEVTRVAQSEDWEVVREYLESSEGKSVVEALRWTRKTKRGRRDLG